MVSTHLKNMIGKISVENKNVWNHHPGGWSLNKALFPAEGAGIGARGVPRTSPNTHTVVFVGAPDAWGQLLAEAKWGLFCKESKIWTKAPKNFTASGSS